MTFKVLEGGKNNPGFVCGWCGHKATTRTALDTHWAESPQCKSNKNVNNPRQEKYWIPEEPTKPEPLGE